MSRASPTISRDLLYSSAEFIARSDSRSSEKSVLVAFRFPVPPGLPLSSADTCTITCFVRVSHQEERERAEWGMEEGKVGLFIGEMWKIKMPFHHQQCEWDR